MSTTLGDEEEGGGDVIFSNISPPPAAPPQKSKRMKYTNDNRTSVIKEIKRISKPGLRVYVNKTEIPRIMGGLGTSIISTSKGVMTGSKAREIGVGGEILCSII